MIVVDTSVAIKWVSAVIARVKKATLITADRKFQEKTNFTHVVLLQEYTL